MLKNTIMGKLNKCDTDLLLKQPLKHALKNKTPKIYFINKKEFNIIIPILMIYILELTLFQ